MVCRRSSQGCGQTASSPDSRSSTWTSTLFSAMHALRKAEHIVSILLYSVSQEEINAVVESIPLACTHFDAIRFFAPAAVPLNTVEPLPTRATQPELEQPGCVHATMDLFRYSLKLWPFLPADLVVSAAAPHERFNRSLSHRNCAGTLSGPERAPCYRPIRWNLL